MSLIFIGFKSEDALHIMSSRTSGTICKRFGMLYSIYNIIYTIALNYIENIQLYLINKKSYVNFNRNNTIEISIYVV